MSYLFLIPVSIALGLTGLAAFFWSMRHDQYEDMDGAAARILVTPDHPLSPREPLRHTDEHPEEAEP
ncbi:MAG: cbb3-type cytochrome oxidase assembly protein CcoS [Gemmobacter sp.]